MEKIKQKAENDELNEEDELIEGFEDDEDTIEK